MSSPQSDGSNAKRLKIGIAIEEVRRVGGTQRSAWEIGARLARDHDVTMITKSSYATGEEPFKVHMVSGGVNVPYLGNLIFGWKISRLKKKLGLDILNAHGSNGLFQDIVTAHSVHKKWYFWSLGRVKKFSKAWWLKILNPIHYVVMFIETVQYSIWCHRRVIAISQQVKRDLMQYFPIPGSHIAVVHHGVNTAEFHPEKRQVHRQRIRTLLGFAEKDYVVIFVAHEFRRKGLVVLLDALAKSPSAAKLIVAGKDDPAPFVEYVERLGLKERVKFVGLQKNLFEYYAASDVFAFPTSYEAFGMVITEAMAAGLPVIVPEDAGAAELIKDGRGGCLMKRWDDVAELSRYLDQLADSSYREQMSRWARETAESRTWDDAARETLAVYRSVCIE